MERIRLDMQPKGMPSVCHASQYDEGRVIGFDLVDGLQGFKLNGDETLELRVRKPDNNIVTAAVTNTSSTYIEIVTTEQMTACEGDSNCEIRIKKDGVNIGTLNFILRVEEDPLKDGIESETEIYNLETQIQDIAEDIVPPIVAEEVANQYDSENVIFDDHPTPGHGTGYVVKSENVPAELNDLDDVDISGQAQGEALVWDSVNNKWVNGTVSTVGGLNDLNDVTIDDESLAEGQELVYNGSDAFENKTTRVELTQAEYDALAEPEADVDYYITDAPSMQGTSADLSYDGGTESVYDKIEGLTYQIGDELSISNVILCGYTSNSAQRVQFFVPLSKPMSDEILNANISVIGDFTMYSVNASEGIVNSSTVGSWTINKKENGIYCRFDLNSQFATQNRTVVAVLFGTGAKITFT